MAKQRMAGYTPLKGAPQAPERQRETPVQKVPTTATHLPRQGAAGASVPAESATPVESAAPAASQISEPAQAAEPPATLSAPSVQKQRMAGYTPLPSQAAPSDAVPSSSAASASTADLAAPATQSSAAAPELAPSKQRMGQPQRMGAPAAQTSAAPAQAPAAPVKQRMGGTTPSPAAPATTAPATAAATPPPVPASTDAPPAPAAPKPAAAAPKPAAAAPEPATAAAASVADPAEKAPWPLWKRAVVGVGVAVLAALVMVLLARWARTMPGVQEFIATYDGHAPQPVGTPEGIPAWLGWQHFLNMFFIVLIIRTGLQVRMEKRPAGYWKPKEGGFFSPKGNTVKKVSLSQWLHQVLDVAWVANGAVFIVLLAVTGHWARIVPTSWEIVPHMGSVAIQYASLDWPTENGWIHYNALQVVAYFVTVYVAAPLAILTGLRMSTWWPQKAAGLNRVFPIEAARALHFPVMLYFVAFTLVHVFLVFFTGALRNLNHMYTSRDVTDWWGLIIFLGSVAVIAAAWFLTRPVFTTPLAQKTGTVTKN